MSPIVAGVLFLLVVLVIIGVVYFMWLRVLHDHGPAFVATAVSVTAFIVLAAGFAIIQGGGLGEKARPTSEWDSYD